MDKSAIVVHGGCGRIDPDSIPERKQGVERAAQAGWKILVSGGSAVDAVEAAVVVLEDNPLFNAGTGSVLNSEGRVETDAAIMDGSTLAAGAVAAVTGVLNPIRLARRVLEVGPPVFLVAKGAEDFARRQGIAFTDPGHLVTAPRRQQWEDSHGTVGACARDRAGKLAAGTSTGGIFDKLPGRVGDTPLIGCGTYANQQVAVSCTGDGEKIIRMTLARLAAFLYQEARDSKSSCDQALEQLAAAVGGEAGIILVDNAGRPAFAMNSPNMPVCAITEAGVKTSC